MRRHSNFSSFQRQLNNFGFRKVEGKGKLNPCMYMHDDLQGLECVDGRVAVARTLAAQAQVSAEHPSQDIGRDADPGASKGHERHEWHEWYKWYEWCDCVMSTSRRGPVAGASATAWARPTAPIRFVGGAENKRRRTDLSCVHDASLGLMPRARSYPAEEPPRAIDDERSAQTFDDMAREIGRNVDLHNQQEQHFAAPSSEDYTPSQSQRPGFQDHLVEPFADSFATGRAPRHRLSNGDFGEKDLLQAFLDNDPTSNLPPNATGMPFFDPATEAADAAFFSSADDAICGAHDRSPQSSLRANIFGKQHRVGPSQRQ